MSGELNKLNDIIVPEPVSWWPLAPGWTVLFFVIVSFLIPWLVRARRHYLADSYRREALREVRRIEQIDDPQIKLERLLELLKRTALTAYSREQVAGLSGKAWWAFLSMHSNTDFTPAYTQQLNEILYHGATAVSGEVLRPLSDQLLYKVRAWIKQHRRVDDIHV